MPVKHVYDLSENDLKEFPVWYFPMDSTVDDELIVREVPIGEACDTNLQIIVRTKFRSNGGAEFLGYIYWGHPEQVWFLKPVMFAHDVNVTFWNGPIKPSTDYLQRVNKAVPDLFPVSFRSEGVMGLDPLQGLLHGIYFKNGSEVSRHNMSLVDL